MDFYQAHQNDRDKFEIIAFHDNSVSNLAELEKKMRPLEQGVWKGRKLPFPVLLDSSGQTVRTKYGVRGFPTVLLIDPTGILVKNGGEHTLEQMLAAEKAPGWPAAISPEGRTLAYAGRDQRIVFRDLASGKETAAPGEHSGPVNAMSFSADGQTLASAGSDKAIQLWNVRDGVEKRSLRGHTGSVFAFAFSP